MQGFDSSPNGAFFHLVDLKHAADFRYQCDGKFSPEVFAEFFQSLEYGEFSTLSGAHQFGCVGGKTEIPDQGEDALSFLLFQQFRVSRVKQVDSDAEGDGIAVSDAKFRELLELVSHPVAEVQWPG